jgi:Skp family chaperone for outer membrane proteins
MPPSSLLAFTSLFLAAGAAAASLAGVAPDEAFSVAADGGSALEPTLMTELRQVVGKLGSLRAELLADAGTRDARLRAELLADAGTRDARLRAELAAIAQGVNEQLRDVQQGVNEQLRDVQQGVNEQLRDVQQGINEQLRDVQQGINELLDVAPTERRSWQKSPAAQERRRGTSSLRSALLFP